MQQLLLIGAVWPEPTATAAGRRMLDLLRFFGKNDWKITFASAAERGQYAMDLNALSITSQSIELNDESFDRFIQELQPDAVLFDRFMTEEQYGWRVAEYCPSALRILDTEDLHCLRKGREEALKNHTAFQIDSLLLSDVAKRELASIYRCDLSLLISEVEVQILKELFQVNADLLHYLPFMVDQSPNLQELPDSQSREHFITIGNFMHPPNWDVILQLKQHIWPLIRKQLPQAELHIYGAYQPKKAHQLHNEAEGFVLKGWAENVQDVMQNARVCLAPLRFGAGLKGKLFDAMQQGTPIVTTEIGAEGISGDLPFAGSISDDIEAFAHEAVNLYRDEASWKRAQQAGNSILSTRFQREQHEPLFMQRLLSLEKNIDAHRQRNFVGSMLQHHTLQSTKYLSKWIEEKNQHAD